MDISTSINVPASSINMNKIVTSSISQNIIPATNNTQSIGDSTHYFANLYGTTLNGTYFNCNNGIGQAVGLNSSYFYVYSSVNCMLQIKPSSPDNVTCYYECKLNSTSGDNVISQCNHSNNASGFNAYTFSDRVQTSTVASITEQS
jgi:hypothetical protein